MNGAESLVRTLLANGVDTCIANPGTSEMHFVAALDRAPGMRCVLGLAEGVVTGIADGYGRMTGKPAVTLLHCGPGLANGLANLHNARRAKTPIVNLVGDVATYHRGNDAPLSTDIEAWAHPVSAWVRTAIDSATVGADGAAAVGAARTGNGGIATLILPSDVCWDPGGVPAGPAAPAKAPSVGEAQVEQAVRVLRSGEPVAIILGGPALRPAAIDQAARIAAATGASLMAPTSIPRIERGRTRPVVQRVPYPVNQALAFLAGFKHFILVCARRPVCFFAYPGKPCRPEPPGIRTHVLAGPDEDGGEALARLAEALRAGPAPPQRRPRPEFPAGQPLTSGTFAQALAVVLPDQAIVVDESISYGGGFFPAIFDAAPHDWLQIAGGAIGDGLPLAAGAALGAPGRRVVDLQADGSAMYTLSALWTQAHERLDVTTVLLSNRSYAILESELAAVEAQPGPAALGLMGLRSPDLDWLALAKGFGVEAARAENLDQFRQAFQASVAQPGPFLIELMI